jgi:ABC-type transporter Mla MlaB component
MQFEERAAPYTIHLEGTFDEISAARLAELLKVAPPGARLALDLSRVREFQGRGLALLAKALVALVRPIDLQGLSGHQARLLQYVGVGPGASGASDVNLARPS